jgi:hypothetical protein
VVYWTKADKSGQQLFTRVPTTAIVDLTNATELEKPAGLLATAAAIVALPTATAIVAPTNVKELEKEAAGLLDSVQDDIAPLVWHETRPPPYDKLVADQAAAMWDTSEKLH